MPVEVERKFLVQNDVWREHVTHSIPMAQGYLSVDPERTVRVRTQGDVAMLTIKGKSNGPARAEFEYTIPINEAQELLEKLCVRPLVTKTRHHVQYRQWLWEVDEFSGDNAGLIVAEIELDDPLAQFEKPDWIGQEVTEDPRYTNARLSQTPYSQW